MLNQTKMCTIPGLKCAMCWFASMYHDPETKRIIKLAQNKKDINRLTNINICIFEIQLSNGCAFKISSVTGPLGYWNYRLYHLHTTAGSSVPVSIVPQQQLLFLLTTKRSWRSILRKRKNSNNLRAINPIRGYKNC